MFGVDLECGEPGRKNAVCYTGSVGRRPEEMNTAENTTLAGLLSAGAPMPPPGLDGGPGATLCAVSQSVANTLSGRILAGCGLCINAAYLPPGIRFSMAQISILCSPIGKAT